MNILYSINGLLSDSSVREIGFIDSPIFARKVQAANPRLIGVALAWGTVKALTHMSALAAPFDFN
jgi:hypothetical protein